MNNTPYQEAIQLLRQVSTPNGFLASAENISNYKRVWARDGVICGLSALASGDEALIATFKETIATLAEHQHKNGFIPSNISIEEGSYSVSYGGLAGRVDAVTWFVIGICQIGYSLNDKDYVMQYETHIEKCFNLLEAWEFNGKHLMYIPLSGNWADEYITDGYVLYDQLLRYWALKCYHHFVKNDEIASKMEAIKQQIELNFTPNVSGEKYHERAYGEALFTNYMPCSFSPSGYKTPFDAFANSLALMLNIGEEHYQKRIVEYAVQLADTTALGLLPAFWPPIMTTDENWNLLKNNCKYEFRNYPYEFHNAGSWAMVNGFFGLALLQKGETHKAQHILIKIDEANAVNDFSFYENFNTQTRIPNGVLFCAWSAAASILVHQTLHSNFKLLL